ncbi:MAG: PDZ domain-containing protein, partial [Planctomycetota bacterium]|nr:PDZ domain-containing protein [Planctomycetota bacterium]
VSMVFALPGGGAALPTLRFSTTPPVFGVRVQPPTPELRHHLALPEGAGLVVHEVLPNTRAAKLGIKKHDILLRLDGELIDTRSQVKRLNEKRGVLEIIRRAKPKKIELGTK